MKRLFFKCICFLGAAMLFVPASVYSDTDQFDDSETVPVQEEPFFADHSMPDELRRILREFGSLETAVIDHLQLNEMDIIDALKLLAQKGDLNIIAGRNVQGTVSLYLRDVRLKDALRIILDANDLAYHEENGLIRVMTAGEYEQRYGRVFHERFRTRAVHLVFAGAQEALSFLEEMKSPSGKITADERSNTLAVTDTEEKLTVMMEMIRGIDVPLESAVFPLSYASAKEMVEMIAPVLTKHTGSVRADERTNTIIVTDLPDRISAVRQMIEAVDVRDEQVLIEAKIIQIKLSDSVQFGVNWEKIFQGIDDLNIRMDFDIMDGTEPNKGTLAIGTVSESRYAAVMEALKKIGETNILSSPRITAVNNREARILVGSTRPYVTTTVTTPASGPSTTAESVTFIDVGVKLYVTPTVHKDGFITMKIRPEVSSVLDSLQTGQNNAIPIVETSEAETTVRIKDGVTVVIGGLIKDEQSDIHRKFPVLGSIPVLGTAFRNHSSSQVKTEIAIFLTPRIISGDNEQGNQTQ